MKFQKKSWWIIVICVVLIVGVVGIFATSAKKNSVEKPSVKEEDNQLVGDALGEAKESESVETYDPPLESTEVAEDTPMSESNSDEAQQEYVIKRMVEFMEPEEVDGSYYYLSIDLEMQNGKWSIHSYGLEK